VTSALRDSIRRRASARCEYCRLPDFVFEPEDFHVEHIIARKHGGADTPENLAWACIFCNLYKGPNLSGLDPTTGELTRLFHPRRDRWEAHFQLDGSKIVGLTPEGRTTSALLEMNSSTMTNLRLSLFRENRW
jgi:hypothetical protein